jgi:hypothetical protein
VSKADSTGPTPAQFAQALVEPFGKRARVWVHTSRRGDPKSWDGRLARPRDLDDLDPQLNHWISTAVFPRGAKGRRIDQMMGVAAIVVDDPTTKGNVAKLFEALGSPTARIETSRGNHQWWYFLEEGATEAQVRPVLARIKDLGLGDASGNNAVRYARLPFGVNNKREHGGKPYRVRVVEWNL